jgi:putative nucleotidyltransferase with HDIG domain
MSYPLLPHRGRVFVAAVSIAGTAAIAHSVTGIWNEALGPRWLILAVLTLLSGSATVKLPSVPATISISETFVFTSVLLYGPSAGTAIVALDGLIISSWFSRRRKELYRILFNMAAPALSIWVAAQVYFLFPGVQPLVSSQVTINHIVIPLLTFTFLHFVINSFLIAFAVSFETGRNVWDIWRRDFLWLSLNYFGGASVSVLLVVYTRDIDPAYLSVIIPLLLILYFTFKIPMARVEDTNKHLTKVNSLYLSTIETLALAIDAKDQVTHGHIRRVQTFAVELAKSLGIHNHEQLKAIEASALLHDMGKLAVPEHILNKPGKLTEAEFEKMKLHASIGADILSSIEFPYPVVPIVRHHHENWDGSGYPSGLCGVDIPIGARILSVVDCFDALTSDRPYRPRLTDDEAAAILLERRSRMYDPLVVDAFIKLQPALAHEVAGPEPARESLALMRVASELGPRPPRLTENWDEVSLFRVYQLLADSDDRAWQDTADLVLHRLSAVLPFSDAAVFLYDATEDELVCETTYGRELEAVKGRRTKVGQGLSGWVAANKRAVVNSPGALDADASSGVRFGVFLSSASAPIVVGDCLIGVITLYHSDRDAFSPRHGELLEGVANHLGPILKRRRPVGQSPTSSLEEFLTARHLDQYVRQVLDRRPDGVIYLIVLKVPPTRTTSVTLLRELVHEVYANLRGGDLVFVCDAETLACLLSEGDEEAAQRAGDRVLKAVQARHGERLEFAVVRLPQQGSTLAALLSRAQASFLRSVPRRAAS